MAIKSSAVNYFGTQKWFGVFTKDVNLLDNTSDWYYDIKQLPVTAANNLNMPSSLPDIKVVTNPYDTSTALVSAFSGLLSEHIEYQYPGVSASEYISGHTYLAASSLCSSVPASHYLTVPYVYSGDYLTYSKGWTEYKRNNVSVFEHWNPQEAPLDAEEAHLFSSTSSTTYFYNRVTVPNAAASANGANWAYRFPHSSNRSNLTGDESCDCSDGWSFRGIFTIKLETHIYKDMTLNDQGTPIEVDIPYYSVQIIPTKMTGYAARRKSCDEVANSKYVDVKCFITDSDGDGDGDANGNPSLTGANMSNNSTVGNSKKTVVFKVRQHFKSSQPIEEDCGDSTNLGLTGGTTSSTTGVWTDYPLKACGDVKKDDSVNLRSNFKKLDLGTNDSTLGTGGTNTDIPLKYMSKQEALDFLARNAGWVVGHKKGNDKLSNTTLQKKMHEDPSIADDLGALAAEKMMAKGFTNVDGKSIKSTFDAISCATYVTP